MSSLYQTLHKKDKKWGLVLNQSRFPLDYVKRHVESIHKVSEAYQYVVHNLTYSGVYLRSTLSNSLLQKVLTLVPLTETGLEVSVATMTTFLSNSYDALEETLTHMKILKPKSYPGENVTYCYSEILVDAESLKNLGGFNPEHLGYINSIFEDTSDNRFHIWNINKYKEVTEFINKLCVCDMDVISQEDLITYGSLVQEATQEYRDLVDSKRWELAIRKENSQDQPSLPKAYTVAIDQYINKALRQVDSKILLSGNSSSSGGELSIRSDMTCHRCGKKGHIQKYCRSKVNGSGGNQPKKSPNDILEWVHKKHVVSDTNFLTTDTTNRKNSKYKWCTSCNNGQGAWGFHWNDGHKEWKNNHGRKPSVSISNSDSNAVIYCSYLMQTIEESTEEEKDGYDSQNNDLIPLSLFELFE